MVRSPAAESFRGQMADGYCADGAPFGSLGTRSGFFDTVFEADFAVDLGDPEIGIEAPQLFSSQ